MEYWAKTTPEGDPGISVHDHMRNVGHVARLLALQNRQLLDLLNLDAESVASLAASHDVGKISQGFQQKCQAWIDQNGLQEQAQREVWLQCESDHSKVSQFSLQNRLRQQGMSPLSAGLWAAAIGGHHGRLHRVSERGLSLNCIAKNDQWEIDRQKELQFVEETFGPLLSLEIDQNSAAPWWLAGLTSVADWVGSDERFFPGDQQVDDAGAVARTALEHIGFLPPQVRIGLDFRDLFGLHAPNDLQKTALELITDPGFYVIEAPMGMGKTEAALWCAYRLLSERKASGIYFALPTQATSNRIHLRMSGFINRITEDSGHTRLVHGNSWLMENLSMPQTSLMTDERTEKGQAIVRDWFASRKRGLLAPFGVGTVDQALLGVVAARHFFVRRFALAGKVVIIDEVHSYDVYTGTLVDFLCRELEKLGCTVILLSATLTRERCAQLLGRAVLDDGDAYPLITGRKWKDEQTAARSIPEGVSGSATLRVSVQFQSREEAGRKAVEVAKAGGCVLWICDTVAAAQEAFSYLRALAPDSLFDVGLLHSRFPFYRREEPENLWMERLGKGERRGSGYILISTQVVEQSVDLDADLIVSELAPTDMLLQRLGRLWRHKRQGRPVPSPRLILLEECHDLETLRSASAAEIKKILGDKALVYAPYILLLSWEVWWTRQEISLPGEIRPMLEATYIERLEEADSWNALANEWFGNDYAKKQRADWETNFFQILLDDAEGVNTRLNERPTVSLVLAQDVNSKNALLLDGSVVKKEEGRFDLRTAQALNRNAVRVPRSALVEQGRLPAHTLPRSMFPARCVGRSSARMALSRSPVLKSHAGTCVTLKKSAWRL
ncbi:CRISPR-associated helicase Cas3' [Thermodesulfobacteriota bacterium]